MTRTISLSIGIAVTALVVAVPAAFGEGRLAGSQGPDAVAYFYANERATVTQQSSAPVVSRPDSHELTQPQGTPVVSRPDSHETIQPFSYMDAAERIWTQRSAPIASRICRLAASCSSRATITRPSSPSTRRLPSPAPTAASTGRRSARVRHRNRFGARPDPGPEGDAAAPPRALTYGSSHLGQKPLRPPTRRSQRVRGYWSDARLRTPVSQEHLETGAQRARPSARTPRAHGPADISPHRSRADDRETVVDARVDRAEGERTVAGRPVRRPELGQERPRRGVGRASARTPAGSGWRSRSSRPRTRSPSCRSTTGGPR